MAQAAAAEARVVAAVLYRAFWERLTGETASETLGAPTVFGHHFLNMHRILVKVVPLES